MNERGIVLYKEAMQFALTKCPMDHPSFQGIVAGKFYELVLEESMIIMAKSLAEHFGVDPFRNVKK